MAHKRQATILAIMATDTTFGRTLVGGVERWVGKCIHCNTRLVIGLDGEPVSEATIEHLVPRAHGGSDALDNLALACARCNHQKGYRHDVKKPGDVRSREVVEKLLARRLARWRA